MLPDKTARVLNNLVISLTVHSLFVAALADTLKVYCAGFLRLAGVAALERLSVKDGTS